MEAGFALPPVAIVKMSSSESSDSTQSGSCCSSSDWSDSTMEGLVLLRLGRSVVGGDKRLVLYKWRTSQMQNEKIINKTSSEFRKKKKRAETSYGMMSSNLTCTWTCQALDLEADLMASDVRVVCASASDVVLDLLETSAVREMASSKESVTKGFLPLVDLRKSACGCSRREPV